MEPQPQSNTASGQAREYTAVKKQAQSAAAAMDDEKESLLGSKDEAFDVGRATREDIGTIVTDKRRKRQSILGVIKDAASEWTEEKAETVKGMEVFQKPVVPKVTPGTERKEIIAKAVETPQAEAQDDHKVVMERIKTFQQDAERVTGRPFLMKKETGIQPAWSHIIGGDKEVESTLPSSGKNFPQVQHIHREDVTSQTHSQSIAPTVNARSEMSLPEMPASKSESVTPQSAAPMLQKKVAPPPLPQDVPASSQSVSQPEPVVPKPIAPAPTLQRTSTTVSTHTPPATAPKTVSAPASVRMPPGLGRAMFLVSLMVIVLAGIGGGAYYFFELREPVVAGVVVPSFLKADARQSLPLPNSRETLLESLTQTVAASSAQFFHIYFVFESEDDTETLATTSDFFGVLEPRVGSAFIRSLDERMMLGSVQIDNSEPFMLLKSNAFDTAFAGMLEWETFMSADLAPLFGEPVARSFSPDARTQDRTTRLAFTDRVVANHNVRTLYDESGNERITYGFVNRNTIILTSTSAAFEKILTALQ